MDLVPDYNLNLISLGQLQNSDIRFHDNPTTMTLTRGGNIIIYIKKSHNLFVLDIAMPGLVMSTKKMTTTRRG